MSQNQSFNDDEQDIARSAFADMILDEDRNERYRKALEYVIREKHKRGEFANVVDIGTGSGLLSLAAAASGADHVTALEMFAPVANIAEKIFCQSIFSNKIDLIKFRSTELETHLLPSKGNIIVAEVFDTELIGEGALRTFKEAQGSLVEKNSRVIPSRARVWILPVQSAELQKFNKHPKICHCSKILSSCNRLSGAFDFQMSVLKPGIDFQALCKPFNFEDADSIIYNESFIHNFTVTVISSEKDSQLKFDCVFLWWDLDMDGTGQNIITMAPTWVDSSISAWRDHWMQAAYFLPFPLSVQNGEEVSLKCSHDEFTFWFSPLSCDHVLILPINNCLMHSVCARSAFYRMNQLENSDLLELLIEYCKGKTLICLNEGSLIGLYAARSARFVAILDENTYFNQILKSLSLELGLQNVEVFTDFVDLTRRKLPEIFDADNVVVMSEPFFLSSVVPQDNIKKFCSELLSIRQKFAVLRFSENCSTLVTSFIKSVTVKAVPVRFDNLWKTVADIGTTLGFDLSIFNNFYQKARHNVDNCIEAHPLWEYPSIVTGLVVTIHQVNLDDSQDIFGNILNVQPFDENKPDSIIIKPDLNCTNAIVFWTEVEYCCAQGKNNTIIITTGLLGKCKVGECPEWSRAHRQGVYFLPQSEWINSANVKSQKEIQILFSKDFL